MKVGVEMEVEEEEEEDDDNDNDEEEEEEENDDDEDADEEEEEHGPAVVESVRWLGCRARERIYVAVSCAHLLGRLLLLFHRVQDQLYHLQPSVRAGRLARGLYMRVCVRAGGTQYTEAQHDAQPLRS